MTDPTPAPDLRAATECRCQIVGWNHDPYEPHLPKVPEWEQADDCPAHPLPTEPATCSCVAGVCRQPDGELARRTPWEDEYRRYARLHLLTQSERATYQSLLARGFNHYEAMEEALDGVSVETIRENDFRAPGESVATETEGEQA